MPLDISHIESCYTHSFRLGKIKKKRSEFFVIQKCHFFATNMYCRQIENSEGSKYGKRDNGLVTWEFSKMGARPKH